MYFCSHLKNLAFILYHSLYRTMLAGSVVWGFCYFLSVLGRKYYGLLLSLLMPDEHWESPMQNVQKLMSSLG